MTGNSRPPDKSHSTGRLPLALAGGGVAVSLIAVGWLLLRPSEAPPETRLAQALKQLGSKDPAAWEAARRTAEHVARSGFRDPAFPGQAEFILGVVAGRAAERDSESRPEHESAAIMLKAAERQGLNEEQRYEWSFRLGSSLFALGHLEEARPLLEETWWRFEGQKPGPGIALAKVMSGLALAEIDLARPEVSPLVPVDQIISELEGRKDLSPSDRRRLSLIRSRSLLRGKELERAGAALDELEAQDAGDPEVALLRSEILLEEGRLDESRRRLLVLTRVETAEGDPGRVAAAAYLLGRCEGRRGDPAAAERAYERAADLAPESVDGIRGALAAARLLQEVGRDEEAFSLFRRAIASQSAGDPPPVPEEEVRRAIRAGWDTWVGRGVFDRAVSLAITGEPVLGPADSVRLQAQGRQRDAAAFEEQWKSGKVAGQQETVRELNDRWKASGEAYRDLAAAVTDSTSIGEALSTAADHFSRGRAFEEADGALTELLDLKLPRLEAAVLARRGRVRLDLGRPDAAAEDFRAVLDRHPTDPVAFEARFSLGRCYLERGDAAKAEATWRELLSLDELTPDASEWRLALFALAELLHRRGVAALARAERGDLQAPAAQAEHASAVAALDEAIARFGEYVRRARESEQLIEARVLRADAMRRRAEVSLGRAAAAETESMRDVHVRESERLLRGAVMEFRAVQSALAPLEDGGRLPRLERELLKSTAFDLGHAYAALGSHQEAIVAYGAAVNRYPDDTRVLPAYLRMAECYRRMDRSDDARAAVEQARLVLGQMPVPAPGAGSSLDRAGWEEWLDRAKNIERLPIASPPSKEL